MLIKKIGTALLLACLPLAFVCAAGSTDSGAAAAPAKTFDGSVLRVGINADCSDLGPFSAGSNGRNSMILTMYQTLGDLDGVGGPLVNLVMKSYKRVDPFTYDIEIWNTVTDTAGNHITAADVVWAHQMAIKAATNSNTRYIKSITQTGDYTLRLVLTADFVGIFENVVKIVPVVSRKAYEASSDQMSTTPIGTTQYKLTNFVPGASATFEKADSYWQKDAAALAAQKMYGKASVKKIVYTTIKEAAQMAIALETGSIDLGLSMASIEAKRFLTNAKYTVFQQVTNIGNQMYLSGDKGSPFATDKALRQAVLYSIDNRDSWTRS